MKIKIVKNTMGDKCWYRDRIGEVFEGAEHHHVLGMAFMDMGDWNVGKQDGTGKDCLVAGEDAEIVDSDSEMKSEMLLRMMRDLTATGRLRIELNDAGEGVALSDSLRELRRRRKTNCAACQK
jgi:hypothetical protein